MTITLTENKRKSMEKLSVDGVISALAFDQRGALKRMMAQHQTKEPTVEQIEELKSLVSEELTPFASSILLDPEYGLPASRVRSEEAGLLLAYEKTGYDATTTSRLPDCLDVWSAKRIKEAGAEAVKFLLYYDIDGDQDVNEQKKAYIERIGSECRAEDIPFYLEILTYDEKIADNASPEFTKEEAAQAFRDQEASTDLPYIYLSAGVSAKLFQDTLVFAAESGAKFNGVLCGRATWAGSVKVYIEEGPQAAREWLRTEGFKNIDELNKVLDKTASPWTEKM
ncbi:TPA: tagatose 1,6-diphosphate aldolase [Streptococcus pyogenes]